MKTKFAALFLLLALLLAVSALADTPGLFVLPAGTTAIEEEAFAGLTSATEFDLPATVTTIGAGAFRGAGSGSAQLRYYFPIEGLTVAPGAFDSCRAVVKVNGTELPRIYYTLSDSGATITGSGGNLTDVVIPDTLGGKPVAAIGNNAFSGQSAMTRVVIPDTVVSLGQNAFRGCKALTNIALPSGVNSLGSGVFCDCQALTAINLPAGVTALPNDAFFGCYALAEIDLSGINSLGGNALRGCRSLTEVTIPEGITTLPNSLFEDATGLTQVHLPSTLTAINNYAFYGCKALTEISIPAGVTAIPNGAFQKCSALQSVQLPAGMTSIAQNAFRECTRLTQINFPAGLTSIGNEAFRDTCVGQAANAVYVLPDSVETFGSSAFYNCGAGLLVVKGSEQENFVKTNGYLFTYDANTGFRYQYKKANSVDTLYLVAYKGPGGSVTIPAEAAVIGENAFANNTAVTAVTIPNTVTALDRQAFRYCINLARVTMADSVTAIGISAFAYCANLTDVTFSANLTTIDSDAFDYACTAAGTHFYRLPDHIVTLGWTPFSDCGAVPCFNRGSDTAALFQQNQYSYTYNGETDFRYRWYSNEGTEGHQERLMQYTGSAQTVNIPAYIWLIDANVFKDNAAIRKVVIPEGVTHIYANAFRDCANLADITLPDTLTNVEDNAFYGCGCAASANFTLELPANINVVRPGAFTSDRMILVCGLNTTTADRLSNRGYAFVRADRPTELDFRYRWDYFDHVWNWGLYDYAGSLSSVLLPDDCRHVNSAMFQQKPDLELKCNQLSDTALGLSEAGLNFTFPGHEGLRYRIIDGALNLTGCVGTPTELIIPQATAYINAGWEEHVNGHSFENRTSLTRLVLPEGMIRIKSYAFKGCLNLTDVTFPDSLQVLDDHSFEQCGKNADSLHYYVLPDSMTSISTNVDAGWGAFTDINMGRVSCNPDTTTALQLSGIDTYNHGGSYLFALKGHETDGLLYQYRQYTVNGEPVNRLELRRYEGSGAAVNIPAGTGLYRIENNVFKDHQELQQVTLPDGLVEIGENAFSGCTLLHGGAEEFVIQVPGTVKRIQNSAFCEVGNGYAAERFYLVLPGALEEFHISAITNCNAVFVAPGGLAATELYNNWYYYYSTLADAKAKTNCHLQPYIVDGMEVEHVHYGKR
ncbi:MAG: leucine-rich repeat protein [Clostridia bacterium]|nr:leucine-rich repeat protein [Clostridia bacterium]